MDPKKVGILLDIVFGIVLTVLLVLVDCPFADSITAGLVLMIALMLIDMRGEQSQ